MKKWINVACVAPRPRKSAVHVGKKVTAVKNTNRSTGRSINQFVDHF